MTWSIDHRRMSGAEGQNRTVDTSLFRAVLCQLSYLGTWYRWIRATGWAVFSTGMADKKQARLEVLVYTERAVFPCKGDKHFGCERAWDSRGLRIRLQFGQALLMG